MSDSGASRKQLSLPSRRWAICRAAGLLGTCWFAPPAHALPFAYGGAPTLQVHPADSCGLRFEIPQGTDLNAFLRCGPVAAHLNLQSLEAPRILVAFPAGDSGVAAWLRPSASAAQWTVLRGPSPIEATDSQGDRLYGIEVDLALSAESLAIEHALLGSIRTIRDFQGTGHVPPSVIPRPRLSEGRIRWARRRLDGQPGYELSIEALNGGRISDLEIVGSRASTPTRVELRVRALTGERPLTPLPQQSLLRPDARGTPRGRQVLEFLSYREKYLAGSWRFDTYFGRDTLMALAMLAPVLTPEALVVGMASVLERCSASGEVAHEEGIGEFAVLRNRPLGIYPADAPVYDYSMIDESFMLAPVFEELLRTGSLSTLQAARLLQQRTMDGKTLMGESLVRNLLRVVHRTAAFAANPLVENLIGLKPGTSAGQWRDSPDGLGGGHYPYDVNAVFVPAALGATASLTRSGLLAPYLEGSQSRTLARAHAQWRAWESAAPAHFSVAIDSGTAHQAVRTYAALVGVDPHPALRSLGNSGVELNALALRADGQPVPVLHSDTSFLLMFGEPAPRLLETLVSATLRPFPAGLWTPVGLLIANPAFADPSLRTRFGKHSYHGTVIWSWQQALLAIGIRRQLARADLPAGTRRLLVSAQATLWSAINRSRNLQTAEVWSWAIDNRGYHTVPFTPPGHSRTDEANAAQLWSTAFVAL